jgi:hypothetical protein
MQRRSLASFLLILAACGGEFVAADTDDTAGPSEPVCGDKVVEGDETCDVGGTSRRCVTRTAPRSSAAMAW